MKLMLLKLMSVALCVTLAFSFCSCEFYYKSHGKMETSIDVSTSIYNDEDPFAFGSVDELKNAIKKEPKYYNDMQVTVKGTAIAYDSVLLVDFSGSDFGTMERYEAKKNSITIIITDDILYSVLETGDYIEVYGTVKISNGEFYLDNCRYTMIKTANERD